MIKIDKFLGVQVGDAAPDFNVTSTEGERLELSELRGKVVLLDFWATWCEPCIDAMPAIRRARERFGKNGRFVVIGLSVDQVTEQVRRFQKERPVPWPVVALGPAGQSAIARAYNVEGVPATFLIGRDGKVVAKDLRGDALNKELAQLLGDGR